MSYAKNWAFTLNNYAEEDFDAILNWEHVSYVIAGKEVGESGTPHLQCYARFKTKKRLTALKKLLPTAHWEVAKGTPRQNRDYCSKDGDFLEVGDIPKTAGETQRERYAHAWECATRGDLDDIAPDIRIKHYRTLQQIASDHMVSHARLPDTSGMWIHGPTGSGKSTLARKIGEESGGYYLKACNKWWDGYAGEDVVIIEDLDPDHACLGHHIKLWTDSHDFIAEKKGTSCRLRPKKVIITSQYSIDEVFHDRETQSAIKRRCEVKLVDHQESME